MYRHKITFLIYTAGLFIGLVGQVQPLEASARTKSSLNLRKVAKSITVKVFSGDGRGSGILVQRKIRAYLVLTNEHVLNLGDKYRVQTPDGLIYPAHRYRASFRNNDLGLLQFNGDRPSYTIASLGKSTKLTAGDQIFAAGFPAEEKAVNHQSDKGFVFTSGSISLVSKKALQGGYQVGYTNDIQQGMSGGPVINTQGKVVAVNGMHAYPIWGDPYLYQDGSKPYPKMRDLMIHSSWGIPIEIFTKLAPQAISSSAVSRPTSSGKSLGH